MGVIEFFRGTPGERVAAGIVSPLDERRSQHKNLNGRQQADYDIYKPIAQRPVTRRRFLFGSVALVLGAVVTYEGWTHFQSDGESNDQGVSSEKTAETIESWRQLLPKERLNRLWSNQIPEIQDFDSLHEVVQASAEFYCSQVPSKFTPEELVSRTHIVKSNSEYVNLALEKGVATTSNPNLSREDLAGVVEKAVSAFTSENEKEVFVNLEKDKEKIAVSIAASTLPFALNESSELLKAISSDLLHEYGHVNETVKEKPFDKTAYIEFFGEQLEITGMVGVNFDAFLNTDTRERIVIHPDEALIDTQMFELSRRAGNDIINYASDRYDNGRQWVSQMNKAAGISFDEAAKYITGDLPIEDLFFKWGGVTTNGVKSVETRERRMEKGRTILAIIGLEIDDHITTDSAYDFIVNVLSPVQIGTFQLPLTPVTPTPTR